MAKAKKIKKEELELVNEQQNKLNELLKHLGILDVEKINTHSVIKKLSDEIQETKEQLEKTYGSVNIDLQTGKISEITKQDVE